MSASPSKRERWPIPKTTRHVWVLRDHRWEVPWQGYIVLWKRHSYRWFALVFYIDHTDPDLPEARRWMPVERLVPVRSVPEDLMGRSLLDHLIRRRP